MGLTYTWGVSEGVLPVLMVNAALYVAVIRGGITSLLKKLGLTFTFTFTCKKEAAPSVEVCVMKFKGGSRENLKCIFSLRKAKEGQQISILPCNHAFHKALDQWLQQHSFCPLCKLSLHQITKSEKESRLSDDLQTLWL
ncbi:hypothetical protein SUGI_0931540 [Cryptomeria japonica]|nr:hypothetical protein SUGI_0931540 [Cryptomeria japonica]